MFPLQNKVTMTPDGLDTPEGDFGPPVVDQYPGSAPSPTNTTTTDSGKFPDIGSIISGIFKGNSGMGGLSPALLAAYLGQTWNHFKDSDRYLDIADKYSGKLDPFGSQRDQYQAQLARLMSDPEGFLKNDPFLQGQIRLAVDPARSIMRAKGYGNSGNILSELTKLSGDVTSKYIGDLRKDLGNFSGAQFGPGAMANLLGTAMTGSINSRNSAIQDIGALLAQLSRGTNTSGGDDTFKDVGSLISALTSNGGRWTSAMIEAARRFWGTVSGGWDTTAMQEAGLSPNDIQSIITNGEDTGLDYGPPPTEDDFLTPGDDIPEPPPYDSGEGRDDMDYYPTDDTGTYDDLYGINP